MLYTALLNCVKNSLNKMKARVCVEVVGRAFYLSRDRFSSSLSSCRYLL